MARRKSRRKAGARYPGGKLKPSPQRDDLPEALAMRRMMVLESSGAAHDMRAEYPLGVCRARTLVREVEHLAGLEYARLHQLVDRHVTPPSCLGETIPSGAGSIGNGADSKRDAKTELRYVKARDALRGAGTRPFHVVQNIVVYHHWPRFLDTARQRANSAWDADQRDLAALRQGLEILADVLGMRGDVEDRVSELPDVVASMMLRRERRLAEAAQ